jgi:hypothetical protein
VLLGPESRTLGAGSGRRKPDSEGVGGEWERLLRIQGRVPGDALPERQTAFAEKLNRAAVRRVRCPVREEAAAAVRNRETVRRIRVPVRKEVSPVKLDREAVRRVRGAESAAPVAL